MKIDSLTLKNGETFNLLIPVTKLRKLKTKDFEYYKKFNDYMCNPKKKNMELNDLLDIVYCSYLVNSNGTLSFEEFLNNYPEEYDNVNDLGYAVASITTKKRNEHNKFNK